MYQSVSKVMNMISTAESLELETHEIEIWCDNQVEGFQATNILADIAREQGFDVAVDLLQGHIPRLIAIKDGVQITILAFGPFRAWQHEPDDIEERILSGKPDFIVYNRSTNSILFALEDTAATCTGNQSQQRAERFCSLVRNGIPTAYCLPAYATKPTDSKSRRPNLWMPITALKLIEATGTLALIFTYADEENPDDRTVGEGFNNVMRLFWGFILRDCGLPETCESIIRRQIRYMLDAIDNQHEGLFSDLPGWDSDSLDQYEESYYRLTRGEDVDPECLPLNWNVPIAELELKENEPRAYIPLPLARRVDSDIAAGRAYFPSIKRSRGKPPTRTSMFGYVRENRDLHRTHAENWPGLFPLRENHYTSMYRNGVSSPGRLSSTVLNSGLVRYERFRDLRISLETAEAHLAGQLTNEFDDRPALLFVASNVKADVTNGWFLRDPYAGMLPSFAVAGGCLDPQQRTIMVTWFPWQTPCLALRLSVVDGEYVPQVVDNKGTRSWLSITPSFTLFNNGLMVHLTSDDITEAQFYPPLPEVAEDVEGVEN
jgi:hypothetical protein